MLQNRWCSTTTSTTTSSRLNSQPPPFTALAHRGSSRRSRGATLKCSCSLLPSNHLHAALSTPLSVAADLSASTSSLGTQQQHLPELPQPPPPPPPAQQATDWSRRDAVLAPVLGSLALQLCAAYGVEPQPAAASKLGPAADSAWEAMGGGPADLTFPDSWLGVWDVTSTLVRAGCVWANNC